MFVCLPNESLLELERLTKIEQFSYDLEMKTREQANARGDEGHPRELSRNQLELSFDVILQHDWPIEQRLLHIRIFFGGKTKRPCFEIFSIG